jgi:hypothetical protein
VKRSPQEEQWHVKTWQVAFSGANPAIVKKAAVCVW